MNKPTSESLAGALACMKALQFSHVVERRGFDNPETNDNTIARYFRDRDEIKATFIESLGATSSFQIGFISVIAEYIHISMACGAPDEFIWRPEALMTESEVKEEREKSLRHEMEAEAE